MSEFNNSFHHTFYHAAAATRDILETRNVLYELRSTHYHSSFCATREAPLSTVWHKCIRCPKETVWVYQLYFPIPPFMAFYLDIRLQGWVAS